MKILNAFVLASLSLASLQAHADVTCDLAIRDGFRKLVGHKSASESWVSYRRIDPPAERGVVPLDGTVFAAELLRFSESTSVQVPHDFTFRSGWALNTQFSFRSGDSLRVQGYFEVPSGELFYALDPGGSGNLTIFAKADGTLCNKVMNSAGGNYVFLVREYKSSPPTKLVPVTKKVNSKLPLSFRVVYLGASGGIASFRALWVQDGAIIGRLEKPPHRSRRAAQC